MYLEDDKSTERLSSLDNLINKLELRKIHNGGRPKGRKNDTEETRLAIAETAIVDGPVVAAREFSTTPSRASLLSNGIVTHGIGSDDSLAPKVADKKEKIHNKALDIIMQSLDSLGDKVNDPKMKASELSAIASDMAKIAERTGGRLNANSDDNKPRVNVVVYAPRIRTADEYEEVEV